MGDIFRERIRKFFKSSDLDAVLLYNGEAGHAIDPNFYYFTGMSIDNSLALLTPDSATLYCAKMNLANARENAWMECVEADKGMFGKIRKRVRKGKIGADYDSIPASRYLRWRGKLGKLRNAGSAMSGIRAVKDEKEIALISKAVRIGKDILGRVESGLEPGMTELDVSAELLEAASDFGVEPSFEPIVAAGSNSRFPHYIPQKKKIGKGMLLVDFGVKVEGYCSDLTRCFFLGKCKREEAAYSTMQDIFAELLDKMPEFEVGADIAAESKRLMKKHRMPELPHSIGHGIGLEVHESPSLRSKSKERIGAGNALAIEPSAYFKDFGVRFEEDVLVLAGKKAKVL